MNSQFELELKKRLNEEIEKIKDAMSSGISVNSHSDYMKLVGKCAAFREVQDVLCGEVSTDLNMR